MKRQLGERIRGPLAEDEEWWNLCFDTETFELSVLKVSWRLDRATFTTATSSVVMTLRDFMELRLPGAEELESVIRDMFDA